MVRMLRWAAVLCIAMAVTACQKGVDAKRIEAANASDWLTYGRTYDEQRFSPLDQVNKDTVGRLGVAWWASFDTDRGQEATPLVADGVLFTTTTWSKVFAFDAKSGKQLWTYDPGVPGEKGFNACCDVVNRGVALWKGKVYVGALDGRLIALDAKTGKSVWSQQTTDNSKPYTITGAPRVVKDKVLIGNGGAEYGVRGYITAYDAASGKQAWRWFIVPGDPSKPFEDESMAKAAKTWDPSAKYWEAGGGGTAWDTMSFDPELNLMFVGTGNGSPWARSKRSPAGGDNLYLASIVALNPDTGKYVWHYQETPGDNWDYTSTQPMILADLKIAGKPRKVVLHAPKNGFFFVIDRKSGQLISAEKYTPEVNWATGYGKDGRPMETPVARAGDRPREITPSAFGAHNWHSMSFNPKTGLVYLPVQNVPINLLDNKDWTFNGKRPGEPMSGVGWNIAMFANVEPPQSKPAGRLVAWDPVNQKAAWQQEHVSPWNGGTLTTAGNLVFQGTADGRLVAYNAASGDKLWETSTGTGVVAAPTTYLVDGKQYVSIAVGWGGVYGITARATEKQGPGTVYTFAVGATAKMPDFVGYRMGKLLQGVSYDPKHYQEGTAIYVSNCVFCHGVPGVDRGGNIPNLGYSAADIITNLDRMVFKGPYMANGMPDFTGRLSAEDVEKVKAFIQGTADAIRPK